MGLDNGLYIKSNVRKITRGMLPEGISFPFDHDYDDEVQVLYWRKYWGVRNEVMRTFDWHDEDNGYYELDTPEKVMRFIEIVASWLNEERWEEDGHSIWTYDEVRLRLIHDIINLSIIYTLMESNPDIYLIFYDSY